MSSPSQAGPSSPREEKKEKGFSKLLNRTKTFLKRESSSMSSKRQSTLGTSQPAAPAKAEETPKTRYGYSQNRCWQIREDSRWIPISFDFANSNFIYSVTNKLTAKLLRLRSRKPTPGPNMKAWKAFLS